MQCEVHLLQCEAFLLQCEAYVVEWEGGDEWIRAQFRSYMVSLLATVQSNGAYIQ